MGTAWQDIGKVFTNPCITLTSDTAADSSAQAAPDPQATSTSAHAMA